MMGLGGLKEALGCEERSDEEGIGSLLIKVMKDACTLWAFLGVWDTGIRMQGHWALKMTAYRND